MEVNLDIEGSGGLHNAIGLILIELANRSANNNDVLNLEKYKKCAMILKGIAEDAVRFSV
jgi:hypothetical protein